MLMNRYRSLVLAAALAAACPLLAGASHPESGGVTLYAGGGFRDTFETFHRDVPSLRHSRVGNDHASSVRVAPGCTATLYEHESYEGRATYVDRDVADLRRTSVGNDAVSSLRVHCAAVPGRDLDWGYGGGLALYVGGGFEGRREVFYGDDANLSNNRIGNDQASSARVAPGCRAILYAGGNYSGASVELTYDVGNLGATPVGNDAVSSVRVQCDRRADRDDRRGDRDDRDDRWGDRDRDDRDDRDGGWGSPWGDSGGDRGGDDPGGYGDDRGGRGGATLYSERDFYGRSETVSGDVSDLSRTAVGNDAVSSVRVAPGCRLELFDRGGFGGRSTVLEVDAPSLDRTAVGDNHASSLRLDCRSGYGSGGGYDDRGGVTLYRGGDFSGESETFYRDVPDLGRTAVGNDHASSVRVAAGCRAILYRDADYRGEAAVLTRDEANLSYTPVGNDAVSSIEVDCRR